MTEDYVGYAILINDEWKYEIAVEQTDKVFQKYLSESELDEKDTAADENSAEESAAENSDAETAEGAAEGENSES